jgi:hypothetical protein
MPCGCWHLQRDQYKGSEHGKIVDAALAETNIDWTGAIAILNVTHQFYTL